MIRGTVILVVAVVMGTLLIEQVPEVHGSDDGCGAGNNPYNRPDGTLIQGPGTPLFLIEGCQKRWILHHEDYVSYGFLNPVAQVSTAEINATGSSQLLRGREGTLIQNPAGYVYIIDELGPGSYQKRYVTGAAWSAYSARAAIRQVTYNSSRRESLTHTRTGRT
jgi:hypothetical protein